MEVLMVRRISSVFLWSAGLVLAHCQSYEDSFNRNTNSTGLYVTNGSSNNISQFAADPKSGTLNSLGTVEAGTTPVDIVVNAAGTYAYVVNSGSNDVYFYSIDKTTRKLTKLGSVAAGTTPVSIALHPTAALAFVSNAGSADISRYSVSATTGALISLGAATGTNGGTTPGRIAAISGFLFSGITSANEAQLFTVSTGTGSLMYSSTAAPAGPSQGAVVRGTTSNYSVYLPVSSGNQITRILNSGWPTLDSTTATGTTPVDIAFNAGNTQAYVANDGAASISVYSASSGALTLTNTVASCTNPNRIFVNSASFVYVVCKGDNTVRAYSASTSTLSLIASYATGSSPRAAAGY